LTGQRAIEGGVSALALHGGYLLAAGGSAGNAVLYVLDARRGDLAVVGQRPLAGRARHITTEGHRAFVSLGKRKEVALIDLRDPAAPQSDGVLQLQDPLGSGHVSAEQTHVAAGLAWVAAGGGKVQRFRVPAAGSPELLERVSVTGDANTLAFRGNHLLVGTLVLDVGGRAVELPVQHAEEAASPLAGMIATAPLSHLEVLGTRPGEGERVSIHTAPEVLLSELPRSTTLHEVRLEVADGGTTVPVEWLATSVDGGPRIVAVDPELSVSTDYVLRIGAGLTDLRDGGLGTDTEVRFQTASLDTPAAPVLGEVLPAYGLPDGGEVVALRGEGFMSGCAVSIGGAPALGCRLENDAGTLVTTQAPRGVPGAAAVQLTNPDGLSAMRLGAYRYLLPPRITKVEPASAPVNSRAVITLSGEGLFGGSRVLFTPEGAPQRVPARGVVVDSTGALKVTVPDGIVGPVALTLETPGAVTPVSHTLPRAFTFTLPSRDELAADGHVSATVGYALLAAKGDKLLALDVSMPGSTSTSAQVAGVVEPSALTVAGGRAVLVGTRAVAAVRAPRASRRSGTECCWRRER
jgi:hypothetical protein